MKYKEHLKESDPSKEKKELLALLLEEEGLNLDKLPVIKPRKGGDVAPLSFAQQRLWFLDQMDTGSAYNIPLAIGLKGLPSIKALEDSLNEIIQRHEALRTTFRAADGHPVQVIGDNISLEMHLIDLSGHPHAEREVEAERLTRDEAMRRFDLVKGPLFNAALIRLSKDEHILLLTMHHIVSDGWSLGVFTAELAALYKAFCNGEASPLPELPIQYADFAHWQREWLQGEVLENQLSYWRKQLEGVPVLQLFTDRPRPAVQTFAGAGLNISLSPTLTGALKDLSQRQRVTLFMTLLAAFQTLLFRYTGQEDIVVGSPIANRNRTEIEGLIGFFVNSLAMRTDLSGNPSFLELLGRVGEVAFGAFAHQDLPFEKLVEELHPERDMSRTPLFQIMFAIQNMPAEKLQLPGLDLSSFEIEPITVRFDIEILLWEKPEGLNGRVVYNTDLFDKATIARLVGHYETLLESIVADPDQRISDVKILTDTEHKQILADWNDTSSKYPRDRCIYQVFEEQVEQIPDAVAVVYGDEQLTYRELNTRANQLAHYLRKRGVGLEVLIGICMERSIEMIVGLLGILKAGGAYVPLDPAYPKERLAFILQDTAVPVLLTQHRLLEALPECGAELICLDSNWEIIAKEKTNNLVSAATPENLAYVIYTSGSTGKPKGVLVTHGNVMRLMKTTEPWYNFDQEDVWTLFHSYAFDFSVWEIWGALLYGARLVIVPYEVSRSPKDFYNLLMNERVTVLNQTPSAFYQLIQAEETLLPKNDLALRLIIFGGEALELQSLQPWFKRHGDKNPQLVNMYGITETTVHVTYRPITNEDVQSGQGSVIGERLPDLQLYVLDGNLQPVPIGVAGELFVGGAGLARGYHNRPELTVERFIPNPFNNKPGDRLYKTGDVARYLPNRDLEYFGRADQQVQIRGFRVELGEIEVVLAGYPGVNMAVVTAREDWPGDKRLVAYMVPKVGEALSVRNLRSFLKEKLPDYMVPAAFVVLESLPLTPNGKVDRRALPTPDGVRPELDTAYQVPRGGVEQTLAQIWKQILRVDEVGRQDNFFELGGDSILSIQIVAKANQAGLRVTPKHLFQYQTIAELAEVVEALEPVTAEQGAVTGKLPLSPIQHWFFGRQLKEPNHWNMAWVLEAKQPVDPEKMEQVVEALLRHHDALRLRFLPLSAGWKQELGAPNQPVPFTFIDMSHLPYDEAAAAFSQEADRLHTTLNLSEGPLIQVALFKFSENQADRVLLVIHHLAVDGISWRILLDDLQTAYDQLCERGSIQLPPKTTSFKEWTEGLVDYAQSNKLHEEVSYWGAVVNTPWTPLPRDFVDGINTVASTQTVSVGLGREDTQALLQEIPEVYHTQINDVLLTALADVLAQWSQQETVCLDLEGHGREELLEDNDLSRTVGWFTSIFPVVLKGGDPAYPGELLKSVKEQLRQIPHRGIGYGLLRYVSEAGKLGDQLGERPDPEVAFNYLGQFDQVIPVDGRWRWSQASAGAKRNPQDKQTHLISIDARIMNSELQVQWSYSEAVHRRETIENLAKIYLASLVTIIRHCQSPEAGGYTPSDFLLARVSQSDLDKALIGMKSDDCKAVLSDLYSLTPLQQGLLFHALMNPESGVYVEQNVFRIEGCTNRDVLRQAWEKVVEQHAILRTGIIWEGLEHPLQLVRSTVKLPWAEVDWRESPEKEHQSRLLKFLDEDRLRGFDLTQAPLMRLTLIQVAETSAILVWSFHHLILDRWSVDLVQQDVWSAYQTLDQGQPLQFNALRPYREYIGWLQDQDLSRAEQHWRQLLGGFTAPTVLGVDQAPPTRVGHRESSYNSEDFTLTEAATSALSRWARQQQLTVNTLVQGAWAILLSRYSGSEDVTFGTTVSGRSAGLPGIESTVGLFINTLPARVHVSDSHCVGPWLTELQEQQVTLREYEYTPLFEIQKWSEVPAGEPLFNTLLVFENISLESGGRLMAGTAGLNVQRVAGSRGNETNYPLTVVVVPGRTLKVRFTYDTEHYPAEAIARMVGHFQQVLTGMIGERGQTLLGAIPLLREAEHQLMLIDWNDTKKDYPENKTLVQLFEEQVETSPDSVAITFEDAHLTYRELNQRANQLAHHLHSLGVGPGIQVGIWLERSLEMVVGLLGTLKAGGAYVPLDPSYPQKRLAFMLEDAQAPVLLTRETFLEDLPAYAGHVVCMDKDVEAIASESEENPISGITADSAAYVIYTSGSTGTPKGVIGLHRGAVNRLSWMWRVYPFKDGEVCCQKTYLSFLDSVWEIFGPLLKGVPVTIIPEEVVKDPHLLVDNLAAAHVSRIVLVPSLLRVLLDSFGDLQKRLFDLKIWVSSGEEISVELAQRFGQVMPEAKLINLYGSSEVSADVSCYEVADGMLDRRIPIGRPIDNTSIYILDSHLQSVPIGVPAELYIGGVGLARGYLNQPDLTAERFIPSPFAQGEVLFKTGDLGRYLPDGNIEYLGRIDHQVKVRGFRIELGEIESQIKGLEAVSNCVVVMREDRPADQRLTAYYVCKDAQAVSESEVRRQLQAKLPEYMLPQHFVELSSIPLTPSGKVDRQALPKPQAAGAMEQVYVAPRTEGEQRIAAFWQEVLNSERVGVNDDFFELGGHSLLAVQIISRIREVFEVELPVRALFEAPTVAGLTERIETARRSDEGLQTYLLQAVSRDQDLALSFAQERLWFLHHLEPDSAAYSMSRNTRLKGVLRKDALEKTYVELARRHETLRTTFQSADGNPVLRIAAEPNVLFDTIDLRHLPEVEREAEVKRLSAEDARKPFDLTRGPLFRIQLFQLEDEEHVLHFNMHHIISDFWSFGVMAREIATLYTAFIKGKASDLPELPVQYADYAIWQRQWLQGEALETQLNYWKDKLGGELPVLELPTDRPRPAIQTHSGAIESLDLSKELTEALQAMSRREGVTLFMTLLAAFKILLYRLTGQEDTIVGTPIAGRNRTELEGLIGFFMNTIVMRTDLAGQPSFRELLGRVRETALGAYEHQDMPFERLVEELSPERDLSRTPLFQVFFNHIVVMGDKAADLPRLEAETVGGLDWESKFDMTLYVWEGKGGIKLHSSYNTDLFDSWRMAEMLKQYEELIKQIVENPDEKISHYSLVTAEAHQVLPDPSALLTEPLQTSLIEMFANWVKQTPEQPALSKGDQTLTYEMLFKRTQILAGILRLNGLDRGDVVAVYGPRSFGSIVNMMAIFLSGGVLLPVDSSLPRQRQQLILQEAGAKFLLYIRGRGFEDAWWERDSALGVQSLEVDTKGLVKADTDVDLDAVSLPEPGIDDAAYIFFTSGTTGVPKGVLGSNKGLNHFLNWQRETFDITPGDRVAHLTSVSFDPVLREIFLPLTSGATLCLPEDIDILAANDVLSWLDRERISVLHTVPSLAQSWITNTTEEVSLNAMRWVFFAGESLTENLVNRWQSSFPSAEIVNLYGPAETTLAKCFYQLSSGVHHGVQPLGRPLPQTQALVLSRDNQLCSIGEPGEIVLRTPFRSLGYINNHEENRKRFVKNPFRDDEKDQLYYTGDRGRYRPDGMLEFLGRLDDQVKIRGVRVEPNEVTVTLARHPAVDSCFVTNKRDEQRQPRLVAYVVITEQSKTTVTELRVYLKKQLPDYMIPSVFVFLDALPLTTRGKVDRRALPGPDAVRPDLQEAFVAPRSQSEGLVAGIWSNVLGLEHIGVHDNFFELGGHSLLATRVVSRIQQEFQVDLKLMDFFKMPTIAEITKGIEGLLWIDAGRPREDEAEFQDREEGVV